MVMIIRVSLFSQKPLVCFAVRQQIIIDEAMWQYLGSSHMSFRAANQVCTCVLSSREVNQVCTCACVGAHARRVFACDTWAYDGRGCSTEVWAPPCASGIDTIPRV